MSVTVKNDGVVLRADGFQRSVVFDSYLEKAFENHRRPRKDAQRVLYFDITFDNYRFGIPNT